MAITCVQWDTEQLDSRTVWAKSEGLLAVSRHCPERPYGELHVPEDFKQIIAVIFTISSHDQGKFPPA